MPFDTASGVGKVNSTLKAKLRAVKGTAPKPRRTKFNVKIGTFLLGRVIKTSDMNRTAVNEITIRTFLNLWNLSKIMPTVIDPKIPEMIKTPPNNELSEDV